MNRIKSILVFVLAFAMPSLINGQYAAILNTNIKIFGVLNNEQVIEVSDYFFVKLNKETGEFELNLPTDELEIYKTTPNFKPDLEKNSGKELLIAGFIPLEEVLGERLVVLNFPIPVLVHFNDLIQETSFDFTIQLYGNKGFSVLATGDISSEKLEIENVKGAFEENLHVQFGFTGF